MGSEMCIRDSIWTLGSVLSSSEAEEIRNILEAKEETAWDKEAPGVGGEGYQTTHARASCLLYVDEVPALRKVLDTFSAIWILEGECERQQLHPRPARPGELARLHAIFRCL